MPQCDKCKKFYPPGFVGPTDPRDGKILNGNLCTFCITGKDIITYGNNNQITKKELIKEYQIFMKKIVEKNEVILDGAKGLPIKGIDKML